MCFGFNRRRLDAVVMTNGMVAYYYRLMQVCQVSALTPTTHQRFRFPSVTLFKFQMFLALSVVSIGSSSVHMWMSNLVLVVLSVTTYD